MVTGQVQRKVNIDLDKVLAQLKKKAVYVGIPKENSKRDDGEMTNASLLMIHSKGSPLRNLPARPVIEPAIEDETNKAKISKQLIAAAGIALLAMAGVAAIGPLHMQAAVGQAIQQGQHGAGGGGCAPP